LKRFDAKRETACQIGRELDTLRSEVGVFLKRVKSG